MALKPDPKLAAALGIKIEEEPEFDTFTPWEGEVKRAQIQDIQTHAGWVIPKIQGRWPHKSPFSILTWLNSTTSAPGHLLIHTNNGLALAYVTNDPQDPTPIVEMVFAVVREYPAHKNEIVALYLHILKWTKATRVPHFRFGFEVSDFPRDALRTLLKPDRVRNLYTVDIKL
jgi:hypothetical protein